MTTFSLGSCVDAANNSITLSSSGSDFTGASYSAQIVSGHVAIAQNYANQAFANSWCFLTGLANLAPQLNDLSYNVTFDEITVPEPSFNKPDAPDEPLIDLYIPAFPVEFVPENVHEFDENTIGTIPVFTDEIPTINLPVKPGDLSVTAPGDAPDIETDFNFPDPVSYTLPDVPTFESLNLPTALDLNIPTFDLDIPTVPGYLVPPGLTFNFNEQAYSSTLFSALTNELLNRIQNGGTGLTPDIEQAIWDRARNREDQNAIRSENNLSIEQASRGFKRPSGAYLAAIDFLAQETQNKNADLSREIAIKQAELEQKNIEFALQTSLALEQSYIQYYSQVQQRAFDTEKYLQEAAINIYEAQIKQFGIQLEIYKTYSQAFESRVKAELAKEIGRAHV